MTIETIAMSYLDTGTLDPNLQKNAYEAAIDHTLKTVFLSEPIYAHIASCYLGPLHLIKCVASPRRSERTSTRIIEDRHDGISVQLAISGASRGEAAGRKVESNAGTIMVLDFGQPFCMVDLEERSIINVSIPRVLLARYVDDVRAIHGLVLDAEASALLAAHLQALAPRLKRLPVHSALVLGDIILQLFLIAIGYNPKAITTPPSDRRTALVGRAKRIIDSRLGSEDLTPEWLMAKLNVSRSELYAALDQFGGVARFIWRRRLDGAHAALIDPHDTRRIGAIAFAFGFSSEAHFARAFRTAFGNTATEVRRQNGQGA